MDDLVKRLRNRCSYEKGVEDLCENAADEIERLREALRNIESVGSQYSVKSGPAWAMRNIAHAALTGEKTGGSSYGDAK